ncbi:hypothetical protein EON66_09885 [archaeon]|nr:MAG: hypothetical protein EON66_09885 [archaeon]
MRSCFSDRVGVGGLWKVEIDPAADAGIHTRTLRACAALLHCRHTTTAMASGIRGIQFILHTDMLETTVVKVRRQPAFAALCGDQYLCDAWLVPAHFACACAPV